jgi:hypothetical protein
MGYVRDHKQNGDVLYIYYAAQHPFEYYAARYGLDENDYIIEQPGDWGEGDMTNLRARMKALDDLRSHPRVWILFLNAHSQAHNDELLYLGHLNNEGTRIASFNSAGAAAYLYDLSEGAASSRDALLSLP